MEFTNADVYYGEYKQDKRNGVGALHFANGDHIEGSFVSETRYVCLLCFACNVFRGRGMERGGDTVGLCPGQLGRGQCHNLPCLRESC